MQQGAAARKHVTSRSQVLVNFPLLAANWLAVEASGCKGAQDEAELEAESQRGGDASDR